MLSISVLSVFRINFINLLTKIRNYFYTNALLLYFLFLQSIVFRIQMNRMRDYSSPTLFQGRIASHTPAFVDFDPTAAHTNFSQTIFV